MPLRRVSLPQVRTLYDNLGIMQINGVVDEPQADFDRARSEAVNDTADMLVKSTFFLAVTSPEARQPVRWGENIATPNVIGSNQCQTRGPSARSFLLVPLASSCVLVVSRAQNAAWSLVFASDDRRAGSNLSGDFVRSVLRATVRHDAVLPSARKDKPALRRL